MGAETRWLAFKTLWGGGGSVLVVGLVARGAGEAVLRLTGAGAEAVQPPAVFGVVDVVLEEKLRQTNKRVCWDYFCTTFTLNQTSTNLQTIKK